MTPEESDSVFPHLYLPIMVCFILSKRPVYPLTRRSLQEEGNRRTLEPWRTYLLTPSWFQHRRRVRQLNQYIIGVLRCSL